MHDAPTKPCSNCETRGAARSKPWRSFGRVNGQDYIEPSYYDAWYIFAQESFHDCFSACERAPHSGALHYHVQACDNVRRRTASRRSMHADLEADRRRVLRRCLSRKLLLEISSKRPGCEVGLYITTNYP